MRSQNKFKQDDPPEEDIDFAMLKASIQPALPVRKQQYGGRPSGLVKFSSYVSKYLTASAKISYDIKDSQSNVPPNSPTAFFGLRGFWVQEFGS